jgi:hypothetical protein
VSRPTIDRWITRFEAEHMAGLADKSRAPKAPTRKVWLPRMIESYHLQKRHPDAGRFRLWSLLARADLSERTVGRVMALHRLLDDDIPHQRPLEPKPTPQPHPYKATRPHQSWFMDGRQMDFAIDGVKWWSIIVLDGSSRTMLAGATAPSEASWVALLVLYTALKPSPAYLPTRSREEGRLGAPPVTLPPRGATHPGRVSHSCGRRPSGVLADQDGSRWTAAASSMALFTSPSRGAQGA